jgi:hypothetical protein
MLRSSSKQMVNKLLDESYFGLSNFEVEFGNGDQFWLKLNFIPRGEFHLKIQKYAATQYPFQITEAPGRKFLTPETSLESDFENCLRKIPGWILRIKEEVIDANPVSRELENIRKQLEERINILAEGQEDFFTVVEADQLKEKLRQFAEKLDSVSKTNDELRDAVKIQKNRIDELIGATEVVNKGTWLRMAGSRFLSTAKAVIGSKEGREFALETAKQVLLEGPK